MRLVCALALIAVAACDCTGPEAPPGTSSFHCTCECGVFVLGQPVDEQTRLTPRFEVCLVKDDLRADGRLFARDVLELCDRVCKGHVSAAVREIGCVDRPDLCADIQCSDDLCRGAERDVQAVFVPSPVEDGGAPTVDDQALAAFGFARACRDPGPDAGLAACDEAPCALEEVRRVAVCGDGVLQEDEDCDGPCTTLGVCPALVEGTHGVVACADDCTYDTSGCRPFDEEVDAQPDLSGCVEENEARLQERVLDVLRGCSVVVPSDTDGDCDRIATAPVCLAP